MFSALVKAFTGRAGVFASLLALSLIGLTVAAVLLNLPKIEQKLQTASEQVLVENMATGDSLSSLRIEGRNLIVEGEFADAADLHDKLASIEGVRRVDINESAAVTAPVSDSSQDSVSDQASGTETAKAEPAKAEPELVTEAPAELAPQPASEETLPLSAGTPSGDPVSNDNPELMPASDQAPEPSAVSDAGVQAGESSTGGGIDQSTLTLRYDGTRLKLSGHLADEQLAQLVADQIRQVVPALSEIEIELDGEGKGSPLNWMNEFFAAVSGLPNDAQGVIQGSDLEGVKIIPDAEQTLADTRRPEAPLASGPEVSNAPGSADTAIDSAPPTKGSVTGLDEQITEQPRAQIGLSDEAGGNVDMAQVLTTETTETDVALTLQPEEFITRLNVRVAEQPVFESGAHTIGPVLVKELGSLAEMMRQHPDLLLRVVGNLDFSVEQRFAEFVGIDRAREIRNYLYRQGIEPFRIFATPLPRDRAFDKRVQVVFYISE